MLDFITENELYAHAYARMKPLLYRPVIRTVFSV
jgi:hypothetical protein